MRRWFGAEYSAVLAMVEWAAGAGLDGHAWRLAWTLGDFLSGQGHWHAWAAAQEIALATAYGRPRRYDQALPHLATALARYRDLADPIRQAHTYYQLSWPYGRQGDHDRALAQAHQALELFRTGEHRYGQAITVNRIGWPYACRGNHREAVAWSRQAVVAFRDLSDADHEAAAWDSVGYAHHLLGRQHRAVGCFRRLSRSPGGPATSTASPRSLQHLGDAFTPVASR